MQKTIPFLMFAGKQHGRAEEAIKFYMSLFKSSEIKSIEYYKANEPEGKEGSVKHAHFTLSGTEYMAIDAAGEHNFSFNPCISIYVDCENEQEIDQLFKTLSDQGGVMMPIGDYGFSKRFAWISDKYGVSWQLNLM